MLSTLYDNLVKNPVTSIIGGVAAGFTIFDTQASQVVSTATPLVDSIMTTVKTVQTGWGLNEWIQFLGSLAMMFYAKDSCTKSDCGK